MYDIYLQASSEISFFLGSKLFRSFANKMKTRHIHEFRDDHKINSNHILSMVLLFLL